ncbi:MAG: DUF5615 family PIN-like protein [Verrucomicrobiota bacterium JB022]|nr:DUF5615 family PIN-like protein [Verrucomicrobiota bacterium JB022]
MKLLANENVPRPSVLRLKSLGWNVASVMDLRAGIPDEEVLAWAEREGRVIWTFDRDYGELIFKKRLPPPAGVIYMRFEPDTPLQPAEVLLALAASPAIAFVGKYSTLMSPSQLRQRPL